MKNIVYHLVNVSDGRAQNRIEAFNRKLNLFGKCENRTVRVGLGALTAPRLDADIIVSHLPIKWRRFPFFSTLRALNSVCQIIHVETGAKYPSGKPGEAGAEEATSLIKTTYSLFDKIVPEERLGVSDLCQRIQPILCRLQIGRTSSQAIYGFSGHCHDHAKA